MNALSENGIEVFDSFTGRSIHVRSHVLGFLGDLVSHHENLGLARSFSKVEQWCMRCSGTMKNKLEKGEEKTLGTMTHWQEIVDTLEGKLIDNQ